MAKTPYAVRSGARVRLRRLELGWRQEDLSKATGGVLSASRIANYEQGTRELGIQEAEILGKALKVSPAFLMGFTELQEYQEVLTDDDKSLNFIVQTWFTIRSEGQKFIESSAAHAKEFYGKNEGAAGADARRSPTDKGVQNARPRNSGKPAPVRVSSNKRSRK